jgi:hypothetical protein
MDGATALVPDVVPATFSVAVLLVALPALFVTATVNSARLSDDVVGGVVYEIEFAPLIGVPFFAHW